MEIHRIGPRTNLPLDTAATEGKTEAKGARRAEPALKPEDPAPSPENESPTQPAESLQAESRLNAESLKARLFARCDQTASDQAAQGPPAHGESSPAADLRDYLRQHPDAGDTLEGIDRWSEFQAMPGLDARGEAVSIDRAIIQAEGWTRDDSATEPPGSADGTDGQAGSDDPERD